MSLADIARLTGYSPSAVHDYRVGRRVPSWNFLLDLIDKIPLADPDFKQIGPIIGIPRSGVAELSRFRQEPPSIFLAAVRVAVRRTRDQFAAKLGVSVQRVQDVERGLIPDRDYLLRVARTFLPSTTTVDDIIAAFPTLRPSKDELKIRSTLDRIRLYPDSDPHRRRLENALAIELKPIAEKIATSAAWKMNRPEYAEEVWGEAVALAIKYQDPRRGLFLSYLRSRIAGLLHGLVRADLQTGTRTVLQDYGSAVREAGDSLYAQLGRSPREEEIARHLDVPVHKVAEVRRANTACAHVSIDHPDFLEQQGVGIEYAAGDTAASDYSRRLQAMPSEWREIIYLRFHDHLPISDIAHMTQSAESAVIETIDLALLMLRGKSVE
ncbi:sigma-70 domain-containing protein [Micromonospora sp. NPDC049171]|uniref:sigma-70 domain-containing protein n=1 Tax=Micromonospora sp. NPDC049171 TaxID=3155770 RepID=UPI0033C99D0E